jgi:WhiB family transcriptional regulator, redox-sensing transcriptional regulator
MMPRSWQTPTAGALTPAEVLEARCRQVGDPEIFYEAGRGATRTSISRARRAKALCALCDIQPRCLEAALATDEPFGIWGGLTRKERERLAKEDAA